MTQFLTDVSDVIAGRSKISDLVHQRPSFYECLPSTAIIEAVNKSLREDGHWVDVPETPKPFATANSRNIQLS
jgi:hypothetical protein